MQKSTITLPNTVYRVSTKAFITDSEQKLLMIYEWKEWSGWRELPWGWLDFGETPIEWLKREMLEEIWVEPKIIDERPVYIWTQRVEHMNMQFLFLWYKVKIDTTKIKFNFKNDISEEVVKEMKFFDKNELKNINLRENMSQLPEIFNSKDFM